ncbi:MAG: hypothetical protein ABEJ68_02830 [Halobacteriaceae archaeon]
MSANYSRRRLLQRGGLVGAVLVAGCSGDGTDDRTQDTATLPGGGDSTATTATTETGTETEGDATDATTETEDGGTDTETRTPGDYPYADWIPAPASTVDGTVNFELWYVDAAAIRSMKASLQDGLLSSQSGKFPGDEHTPQHVEPGQVNDSIRIRTPWRDGSESGAAAHVYLGTFDEQSAVDAYLNEGWASGPTEYEGVTIIENNETGNAIGVSDSVVIAVFDPEGADLLETFVDARAGAVARAHEVDAKVARLFEIVQADTFVRVTYGTVYVSGSTNSLPEGALGTGIGWRVGDQETEKVFAFPFTDEARASAAADSEDFLPTEIGGFEVTESVDGDFVVGRQTVPTGELERFPEF